MGDPTPVFLPNSVIAGFARHLAGMCGVAIFTYFGVAGAQDAQFTNILAEIIGAILTGAAFWLSARHKGVVTQTVVAASETPAPPLGTSPSLIVANAAAVAAGKSNSTP